MCGDSRGAVLTTRTHTLSRSLKILSQIRSHTVCPRTGLGCSVPATAKNNVLGVISTLEALRQSGNQQLSLLAVELYCQLWLNQERCYPQLMGVLDQNCENYPWLANLLQANICKIICDTRPEMHGKEVVPKVSDILNKCGGVKDSAASTLALEALIPLCCHDVVDIFTIWRSLAPRFSRDKRPPVIKRFVLCADNVTIVI
ncbi:hypothetical protein J6590_105276 [Homalodisca vitripennis]|nr:hypothetical protein J6590_105276 [Homalodisca vitripennis]